MSNKLCVLLMFRELEIFNYIIFRYCMHNLYTMFAKFLDICKQKAGDLVNQRDNIRRPEVVYKFSDLEAITLNMISKSIEIDYKLLIFICL